MYEIGSHPEDKLQESSQTVQSREACKLLHH